MRKRFTRRDILKLFLVTLGLSACDVYNNTNSPSVTAKISPTPISPNITSSPTITWTPSPTAASLEETPTPYSRNENFVEPSQTVTQTPISNNLNIIVDGHEDIAWNALEFNRDPTESAITSRKSEAQNGISNLIGSRTTGLPQWINGRIALIFSTLFVMPSNYAYPGYKKVTYSTPEQAEPLAWEQLNVYKSLAMENSEFLFVQNRESLEQVLNSWIVDDGLNNRKVGLLPLMEGADPITSPDKVKNWYEAGLRIIGISWRKTRYGGGTGEPGPLTELGVQLLGEMSGLNMILDLSHSSEEVFFQALDTYQGYMIASHSNPRKFLPTDRGLSDEMIKELAARNGVIGVVLFNKYLNPKWNPGSPKGLVTMDTVADVIDHIVQLLGNSKHVAIGSDFDGGFGAEAIPDGIDTIADLEKISTVLRMRGYIDKDINNIMYGNWVRVLRENLP